MKKICKKFLDVHEKGKMYVLFICRFQSQNSKVKQYEWHDNTIPYDTIRYDTIQYNIQYQFDFSQTNTAFRSQLFGEKGRLIRALLNPRTPNRNKRLQFRAVLLKTYRICHFYDFGNEVVPHCWRELKAKNMWNSIRFQTQYSLYSVLQTYFKMKISLAYP